MKQGGDNIKFSFFLDYYKWKGSLINLQKELKWRWTALYLQSLLYVGS